MGDKGEIHYRGGGGMAESAGKEPGLLSSGAIWPQAAVSKSFYDGVLIAPRMAMNENFTVGSVING